MSVVSMPSNRSSGATPCSPIAVSSNGRCGRRRAGEQQQLRRALALVHAARLEAELGVGAAEHRIEFAGADAQQIARHRSARLAGPDEAVSAEHALRLPRPQPFLDLFGISRGSAAARNASTVSRAEAW